jgi:hypothetical protein
MADLIDASIPDNREPTKQGAQRIRETRSLLNATLSKIFTATGDAVRGIVAEHLAVDSVLRDAIKAGEVIAGKLGAAAVAAANIAPAQIAYSHLNPYMALLMPKAFGYVSEWSSGGTGVDVSDSFGVGPVAQRTALGVYTVSFSPAFTSPGTVVRHTIIVTPRRRLVGSDTESAHAKITSADGDSFTVWITNNSGGTGYDIPFSFVVFSRADKPYPLDP